MTRGNIFSNLPAATAEEQFRELARGRGCRVERIVSQGHTSPPAGDWWDQENNEWVLLLQGAARLEIEGEAEAVVLGPGDHLVLPAHCRHRVLWTTPDAPTIWLAVHYE